MLLSGIQSRANIVIPERFYRESSHAYTALETNFLDHKVGF